MRDELSALYQLLNTLCKHAGLDPDAADVLIARTCSGLEATLDAHLQRITQLEARRDELADELAEVRDRLNDLDDLYDRTGSRA